MSQSDTNTHRERERDPFYLLVSSAPPLCYSQVIKTCQEIIGSTGKGQILFSQFEFSWAAYSKLINRHVMNKSTLIMKRGCPVSPLRLVISMRTHVVSSYNTSSVATSSPRQQPMPPLDYTFNVLFRAGYMDSMISYTCSDRRARSSRTRRARPIQRARHRDMTPLSPHSHSHCTQ